MRGVHTFINDIRRQVFTEVARMAFEGGNYAKTIRELPYKIIPGEVAKYRQNILVERAVVSERIRLAIGLPLRNVSEYEPTDAYLEDSLVAEKYYDPPLINIISFACNACPTKRVQVTNMCQGCLAHPCKEVCPKDAISIVQGKSFIDQEKCIKCGKCADECPYGAILKFERPCAEACGMDAIGSDELGRAKIDYDKCVSCGMCLVNCPFGAISDKSQIFQLIQAIKRGDKVVAAVAPAFVSQFGEKVTSSQMREAMRQVGFHKVIEVAVGADMCTAEEAEDFLKKVRRGGRGLPEEGSQRAALYGHLLLPLLERDGQEAVPPVQGLHLHGHDSHGAHRPAVQEGPPGRAHRIHRPMHRQEAGGLPPHHPQRRGLRAHLRGDAGHLRRQGHRPL